MDQPLPRGPANFVDGNGAVTRRPYRRLFRLRREPESDAQREIQFHIYSRQSELIAAGYSPEEAKRQAAEEFGHVASVTSETVRESRRGWRRLQFERLAESILQDLRFGLRTLVKNPVFSGAAVITLGLSIGSVTAVFTVVDAVVLQPLKYRDPDRIATVFSTQPQSSANFPPSYPDFQDFRAQSQTFEALALLRGVGMTLEAEDGFRPLTVALVTEDFPRVLGARTALGTTAGISSPSSAASTVILKNSFWQTRFGGDPNIIGTTVVLSGKTFVVGGVYDSRVEYPVWADAYALLSEDLVRSEGIDVRDFRVDHRILGRLKLSETIETAQADLATVAQRLEMEYSASNRDWGVRVISLTDFTVSSARTSLFAILGAAGVFLLIGCGNVANLSVARTLARGREIGVRISLGAARARIARQLLVESGVIAFVGTVIGVAFAAAALAVFLGVGIPGLPRAGEVEMSRRVFLFSAGMGIIATMLFGLMPALYGSRFNLSGIMKGETGEKRFELYRSGMVVFQVALAVVLVAGGALLLKSFQNLQSVDPGFDTQDLYTFRIDPPADFEGQPDARRELYLGIRDAVRNTPLVMDAALINHMPLGGRGVVSPIRHPNFEDVDVSVWLKTADAGFFDVSGLSLIAGAIDDFGRGSGLVVSEAFAETFFPDSPAVGEVVTVFKQVSRDPDYGEPITEPIVAVVGDALRTVRENLPEPVIYVPQKHQVWPNVQLLMRVRPGAASTFDQVSEAVRSVDPRVPVNEIRSVRSFATDSVVRERFARNMGLVFSFSALVLALIGTYGVLSFLVRQRSKEIGIRIALGATRNSVVGSVVGKGMALVSLGTVVGLAGALGAGRFIEGMLFATSSSDPGVFAGTAAVILGCGLVAGLFPALRAARTDPVGVLRQE